MTTFEKAFCIDDILQILNKSSLVSSPMRIWLAGMVGVGKTTIAKQIAWVAGIEALELDKIKASLNPEQAFLCSVNPINLERCLSIILDKKDGGFILDMGGDSIFRKDVDNEDCILRVNRSKEKYGMSVVIFDAEREISCLRFVSCKNRNIDEFPALWNDWKSLGEPYWLRCADYKIDTTYLKL